MTTCLKCDREPTRRGMCHNHYEQHRLRQVAYGRGQSSYVGTEEVRRHILMLKAQGMGDRRIAELAGTARNNVREVLRGRTGRGCSQKMLRRNADAILAVEPDIAPGARVDACGTVRRLRALVAIGWTQNELCARIGVMPTNGCQLFLGNRDYVVAATAKRVAEVFDELSMTPGPSQRSRNRARQNRWAPPLAWDDDIDNPDATPNQGERRALKFDERFLELRELGYSDVEILRRWKVKPESLVRQMERYGISKSPELVTLATSRRWHHGKAS